MNETIEYLRIGMYYQLYHGLMSLFVLLLFDFFFWLLLLSLGSTLWFSGLFSIYCYLLAYRCNPKTRDTQSLTTNWNNFGRNRSNSTQWFHHHHHHHHHHHQLSIVYWSLLVVFKYIILLLLSGTSLFHPHHLHYFFLFFPHLESNRKFDCQIGKCLWEKKERGRGGGGWGIENNNNDNNKNRTRMISKWEYFFDDYVRMRRWN